MSGVRVRIAPSPTGNPHVGTAYIGLFNYAFAKSQNGSFVLRIENTDQTRSRKEYEQGIFEALRWIGLKWDEGPDVGGAFGPYRQSERTEIYREHCRKLVESGAAYPCFCSRERLDAVRKELKKAKKTAKYDGHCRYLSPEEVQEKLDGGAPHVIRLKIPEHGACMFHDRFRGEVSYDYDMLDDQVLLKSDGFPTYHLANVVDDHLMRISHVIRGEEWLPSTPKHILIYEAFQWETPEFIHLPLLLNPDGSKLSKRKNPTSITYYRDAGFLPEALLNYLGLMSYSRPNQEEKFSLEEFVSDFDIQRMSLGGAIFDLKKLRWLNGRYIRENFTPDTLWERLETWKLNPSFLRQLIPMMQNRMETLGDVLSRCDFLFLADVRYAPGDLVPKNHDISEIPQVLQTVLWTLESLPEWSAEDIEQGIRRVATFWNWKIREVTHLLFVSVMGRPVGPPLFDSMKLLGSHLTSRRIQTAMERSGGLGKKKREKLEKKWISNYPAHSS